MHRLMNFPAVILLLALTGCASTIRSDVTAFHEWPGDIGEKTYVFERMAAQQNSLEFRAYENLVKAELARLGFAEAAAPASARLKVGMDYGITVRDVTEIIPATYDPWYGSPFFGPRWGPYGYAPFYDPFWAMGPPYWNGPRESRYQLFTRMLKIAISRASDNKRLYEVTVFSEGSNGSLARAMPYMVKSAFENFPGPSGVPRRVELKMKDEPK